MAPIILAVSHQKRVRLNTHAKETAQRFLMRFFAMEPNYFNEEQG